jgi:hypothetical protein
LKTHYKAVQYVLLPSFAPSFAHRDIAPFSLKRKDYECTVCFNAFGDDSARIRHERNIHGIYAKQKDEASGQAKASTSTRTKASKKKAAATSARAVDEALFAQDFFAAAAAEPSPSTSSSSADSLLPTPAFHSNELLFAFPAYPFPTSSPSVGTPVTDAFSATGAKEVGNGQDLGFNINPSPYLDPVVYTPEAQEDMLVNAYFAAYNASHAQVQVSPQWPDASGTWSNANMDTTNAQDIMNTNPFNAYSPSSFSGASGSALSSAAPSLSSFTPAQSDVFSLGSPASATHNVDVNTAANGNTNTFPDFDLSPTYDTLAFGQTPAFFANPSMNAAADTRSYAFTAPNNVQPDLQAWMYNNGDVGFN